MMKQQLTLPLERVLKKQKLLLMLLLFMGSMYVDAQCVSGACNPNAYVNSSDPNTIEYDNIVSVYHSTIIREGNGTFKVWGEGSASDGTGSLVTPTAITPPMFNYTGTILKATAGSNSSSSGPVQQFTILTTDGLYVWGTTNTLISSTIKNTTAFGKITIDGKADGLPAGVSPADVKMMFGSYQTLAIVTCNGDAWVLSLANSKYGDGATQSAANNIIWHRVKTSATTDLTNVVAMRGTPGALFALTSTGKLYTWGTSTYINSGAAVNRAYATEVSVPAGVTPKMIGMTQATATLQTYYLLATDGKLYAMGNNSSRQLGDGTLTSSNTWKEVTATNTISGTTYTLGGNITYISPNEHSTYVDAYTAAINILTTNSKQWAWGSNSGYMIGGNDWQGDNNPMYMPGNSTFANGLSLTDNVIAVETGGHTTVNIKKGSDKFGYVGHRIAGSMGNGDPTSAYENVYTYATSIVMVCGANIGPAVKDLVICQGTTGNLNNANSEATPSEVEWHATNDVNSAVMTNITAVGAGTYYAFYTVTSGKPRTIGSAVTVTGVPCCATGECNSNTYVNSSDPNTIEYDNIVSIFHSTIVKESNGTFKAWGAQTDSNGTGNLLSPRDITPANGYNYIGTPLKATGGYITAGGLPEQHILLTTDGLYVWGGTNTLISSTIKSTAAFGKISVNGKTDGLPAGVLPGQVKMMFGSYGTLAIVTCSGDAWVLSFTGNKNGDGTAQDVTNNVIWHRVKTSATTDLTNVVAMRGMHSALFALTSDGKLYTWGTGTYLGDGSAVANRTYATQVSIPSGAIPKMIGMTGGTTSSQSYYLLAKDGKLYSMGDNSARQLGDGTTVNKTNWVQPQKVTNQDGQGTGPLENIAWISPSEHSENGAGAFSAINVLTYQNKLWAWGSNSGFMIGGAADNTYYNPIYMPGRSAAANGLKVTDQVAAVETSGHTTINIKKGTDRFGYVGHLVYGSMGNNSNADTVVPTYSYSTSIISVCAVNIGPAVQNIEVCQGTTAGNLNTANLEATPSEIEWHATNDVSSPVISNITAVGAGTYYAFYTVASGKSRTMGSPAIVTGVVCCSTGECNPNSYVQSSDPNTIEYDQMVSSLHGTIVKEKDGSFRVWGNLAQPNGTSNQLVPRALSPAGGYAYTGTPLKATTGSYNLNHQFALLTTDGLYVWGTSNTLISSTIKSSTAFGKITVNGKADGLPADVMPQQVKMMFGSYGTLAIVTCNGDAWVLSFTGAKNGDGTAQDATNNLIWHRVKTSVTDNLNDVIAIRGTYNTLFALTADGKLYTWGTGTYINDGLAATNRIYATEVTKPSGVTPKMIGVTADATATYYLLATDGKLYSMGANGSQQLGDGTTTIRTNWIQPQKLTNQHSQGTGPLDNIVWISPVEHDSGGTPAINVLTNSNKIWAWGAGGTGLGYPYGQTGSLNPFYMPGNSTGVNGMAVTDQIIAIETGGHATINIKKGSDKFGYVGHSDGGSMGDGNNSQYAVPSYTYNTPTISLCAADPNPKEGYIYITKKALDENSSVDFNFTVNGGPVTAFTLNDKETKVDLSDLGSSENGRLWGVAGNGTLYYRNAGSSDWVQTAVTTATKVDGAAGNDCYFTNTAGQVLRYDGVAAPTVIGSPANYGTLNATDVGSAWNTTPYIMTSNNTIWIYSGSGTAWSQVGTTTNNLKGVDADPSTGDAIVTDGTLVYRLTSAGVKTSLGAPPGWVDDIAVTSAGEVFSAAQTGHVRKWVSGTTWSAAEETSRILAGRLTAGHKDQAWSTNPAYPMLRSIYTRMVAGTTATWLDDERVRTTNKGNTIMIKVPVGTYTVKEAATSGWELQSMDVYDPTSNSTSNFADKSVTLNVGLNETVYAVFTNGLVNPFAMGNDCSVVFFEDFGSDAAGTVGPPLTGQTSYHYATGSNFAQDGYYKVAANAGQFWGGANAAPYDHTSGNGTGRMMTINASYDKGIFFRRKFTNLVPGKSYKFSAWLMSLSNDTVKPNATFQVVDPVSGAVLNTVSSGDITPHNVWNEYSMNFVPTSTELDLILLNNAPGGNGNDIALDDIRFEMNRPQGLTATRDCSASTFTVTAPLGAIYEYSLDNVNWQASPSFTGVANTVTNYYVRYADALACVSSAAVPSCFCYKPGATTGGSTLDTKIGITALGRAGATDTDNWPMTRKGGWLALESKTKGFVPNRVAFSGGNPVGIAAADFVEGMMVYDTTNKCLKMYTLKDGDSAMAWHCITTQTCPD